MRNAFVTSCRFCRRRLDPDEGEMVRVSGRLVAYCPEHQDNGRTRAQIFARDADEAPTEDADTMKFSDGSIARAFHGRWVASHD